MKLSDLLHEDRVFPKMSFQTKDEVMQFMLHKLEQGYPEGAITQLHDSVYIRESLMSTGVGHGFAIPHGKTWVTNEDIEAAIVTLEEPVDWNSLDGQPVSIVIMFIGSNKKQSLFLKALAHISYLMHDEKIRTRILDVKTVGQILDVFVSEEP